MIRSDLISMTAKELGRLEAMQQLQNGQATQAQVARRLQICVRQVKRLWRAYRTRGAAALVSGHRQHSGNRKRDPALVERAISIVRTHYHDFGPTLASEKLRECHDLAIDRETLRKAMIATGLWKAKARKHAYHPPRARRERFGELIQIDGSPHAWFEERGPRCTLLVFIDDATSAIVAARFVKAETTNAYFALAYEYFQRHGLPEAFYSDRYSVFRINRERQGYHTEPTQFARAMDELGIELICANSPQAKGRVERVNRTLQDRFVKELRLAGVSDIDGGNAFLPGYLVEHNRRFARHPLNPADAHGTPRADQHLETILACHYTRKLTKNLTVQHDGRVYQILNAPRRLAFPKATVQLIEALDGTTRIERGGVALEFVTTEHLRQPAIRSAKEIEPPKFNGGPNPKKAHKPSSTHPWYAGYDPVRLAQVRHQRGHF